MKNEFFPSTVIIRHEKENLKKCTLSGLEGRSDFRFYSYPIKKQPVLENYILLTFEAPELTFQDRYNGILILDATWRYAQKMEQALFFPTTLKRRSLPRSLQTAYPRRQHDCSNPERGLASIEAVVAAYALLGREIDNLLDGYHWKSFFLEKNVYLFYNSPYAKNLKKHD